MKQHHNIKLLLPLLVVGVLVCPTADAATNPSVDVTVRGIVPALCEVGGKADAADLAIELPAAAGAYAGPLSASGSVRFDLNFSCNSKFKVAVQSQQGGLGHTDADVQSVGNFTRFIPYQVAWQVGLDGGGKASVTDCESEKIKATSGCDLTSDQSAMGQTLTATVSWDGAPASAPPLQGDFKDVMTIRLSAIGW